MKTIGKGIYKRGAVYWFALRLPDGKRKMVTLQTSDETLAVQRAAILASTGCEVVEKKAADTLKDQIERYLSFRKATGRHTSATHKWAKRALLQFGEHIKHKLAKSITAEDIAGFYAALRKRKKPDGSMFSENAARSYLRAARGFMSWTVTAKLRFDNPAKEVKLGRPTQAARIKFVTREDRALLMQSAEWEETRFILYCTFWAGMRFNEVVEARPDWFNLEGGYITVQKTDTFTPKNKKTRTIPLSPAFNAFLEEYGLQTPYMLAPYKVKKGKADYRYDFRKPWEGVLAAATLKKNALLKEAGKPETADFSWITPHTARHTFASLLVQQGTSVFKVSEWLGDTIQVTTAHYAHLAPSLPNGRAVSGWKGLRLRPSEDSNAHLDAPSSKVRVSEHPSQSDASEHPIREGSAQVALLS